MAPTILLIPGLFHTETHYAHLLSLLRERGYSTKVLSLPSLSHPRATADPNADSHAARAGVSSVIARNEEVIILAHSYGGVPAQNAVRGLTLGERRAAGLRGGVVGFIALVAFILPVGQSLRGAMSDAGVRPGRFADFVTEPGVAHPVTEPARNVFFGGLERAEQDAHVAALAPQSAWYARAEALDAPWELSGVRRMYVLCTEDLALPVSVQRGMIEQAGGKGTWRAVEVESGHSPFLTCTEEVVRAIEDA